MDIYRYTVIDIHYIHLLGFFGRFYALCFSWASAGALRIFMTI